MLCIILGAFASGFWVGNIAQPSSNTSMNHAPGNQIPGSELASAPGSIPSEVPEETPEPVPCDPNYLGVCLPFYEEVGDLDCGDINVKNFESVGSDPHRLDRDNDGIACEG